MAIKKTPFIKKRFINNESKTKIDSNNIRIINKAKHKNLIDNN